jgi:hypothetical protein
MTKEIKEYLTTEKKQELEAELENLKSVKKLCQGAIFKFLFTK